MPLDSNRTTKVDIFRGLDALRAFISKGGPREIRHVTQKGDEYSVVWDEYAVQMSEPKADRRWPNGPKQRR